MSSPHYVQLIDLPITAQRRQRSVWRGRARRLSVLTALTSLVFATPAYATGAWTPADLTVLTGAPLAESAPFGYTTNLTGQGPGARVVYRTPDGHIQELSLPSGGAGWNTADLTVLTRAPLAESAPFGYTTSLSGQGPVARVVYRTTDGHIQELSVA